MFIQFNFKLNRFNFNSIKLDPKSTEFNSTHFISISTSIQIQFNFKIHINFNSNAIQFQIMNTISNSTSTKISSIRFRINFISMSNKFNSKAITFTSIQFEFQFKTFQFNLNSVWFQINSISIQCNSILFRFNLVRLNENRSFEAWKSPRLTTSRKLQFFKRLHNQKILNFHQPPDLDFSTIFQVARKTSIFNYKNDRFWSFLVEIWKS